MTKENLLGKNTEKQINFLLERKRYDQAARLIGIELAKKPDNSNLLYYSAKVDFELDKLNEAEKTLNHLINLDPENIDARFLLAHLYIQQSRYNKSEALLIDLIRENPEVPEFYSSYAYVMLATLNLDKADRLAREAIRLDPENTSALHTSVYCGVIRKDNNTTNEKLADIIRNYPEETGTAFILISILDEQGKYKEARRIAGEVLKAQPGNEGLVKIIKELRVKTHPSMILLYPLNRFGWHGSAFMWIFAVGMMQLLKNLELPTAAISFAGIWFIYVIYSWIFPPILRRFM